MFIHFHLVHIKQFCSFSDWVPLFLFVLKFSVPIKSPWALEKITWKKRSFVFASPDFKVHICAHMHTCMNMLLFHAGMACKSSSSFCTFG